MWKSFALLIIGISSLLAIPAPAAEKADLVQQPGRPAGQVVEITGELHYVKGVHWELIADGKRYYLDLRGKELLFLAKDLTGEIVAVTGMLVPTNLVIQVTAMKAAAYAKVEIKGKLGKTCRTVELSRGPWPGEERLPMTRLITVWSITANGKNYELTFASETLSKLAEMLKGKVVVVTGTPMKLTVLVSGMKAADPKEGHGEYAKVKVTGQVKRLKVTGHPFADPRECWTITINGERYELDFGGLKDLAEMASNLDGKAVQVSGVLELIAPYDSTIEISTGFKTQRLWVPGRMIIHVASLKVAKAM
jgi:hypothetical protein